MTDDEPTERLPGPPAAYAVNWRTVLVVDGALGVAVVVGGAVVALAWSLVFGLVLAVAGSTYCALVARRARHFAELRRQAGLPPR
jgi:hypothetical protein